MKLYTKFGDGGETVLFDGTRVWKNDLRVAAYGDVDELNAVLGWCRAATGAEPMHSRLSTAQEELFILGAELATPADSPRAAAIPRVDAAICTRLESWVDEATSRTEPLMHFVLPGGTELACRLHVARTVCRRAERAVVALARVVEVPPEVVVYLNRLGDLLFAWARQANAGSGRPETCWIPRT